MSQKILTAGSEKSEAEKVVICLHGRGASAENILQLAKDVDLENVYYLAPEAKDLTWYPASFLEDKEKNQPKLDESLKIIDTVVEELLNDGVSAEKIHLLGFSQGACLALEYLVWKGRPLGGVVAFSGGLIGSDKEIKDNKANLAGTGVFIGCGDRDPHIPVHRVQDSYEVLNSCEASVEVRIYPQMGHTINKDELEYTKELLNS